MSDGYWDLSIGSCDNKTIYKLVMVYAGSAHIVRSDGVFGILNYIKRIAADIEDPLTVDAAERIRRDIFNLLAKKCLGMISEEA